MDYQAAYTKLLGLVDLERMRSATRFRKAVQPGEDGSHPRPDGGSPNPDASGPHHWAPKERGARLPCVPPSWVSAGYHTGFYSSPHIHTFRERIRLDGEPVSPDEFASLVERVWPYITWVTEHSGLGVEPPCSRLLRPWPSSISANEADVEVLEVGLGGRLDTTNVIQPPALKACAITSISLDHTSILGNSLESIAREKAGIIKPGTTVVSAPQPQEAMDVIRSAADENGADSGRCG